ncbi:MAG: hypothetical protein WBV16_05365, partial [Desulfobaccales bacterium]
PTLVFPNIDQQTENRISAFDFVFAFHRKQITENRFKEKPAGSMILPATGIILLFWRTLPGRDPGGLNCW